jgi:hypothetical protein
MKKLLFSLLLASQSCAFAQSNEPNFNPINKQHFVEHKNYNALHHSQQTFDFFEVNKQNAVLAIAGQNLGYNETLSPYLQNNATLFHVTANDKATEKALAPAHSVDRILAFHSVHTWMQEEQAADMFNKMYDALKAGGILGIVQYRNSVLKPQDVHAVSGYVTEDYVIELARKAGFEFLAKSEINANTQDNKEQSLSAQADSDSMTIKFIKPTKTALLDRLRSVVEF